MQKKIGFFSKVKFSKYFYLIYLNHLNLIEILEDDVKRFQVSPAQKKAK